MGSEWFVFEEYILHYIFPGLTSVLHESSCFLSLHSEAKAKGHKFKASLV